MLHQKTKITHLLDELLQFVLESEPQKVSIEIEELDDRVQITVSETGARKSVHECREAECFLNAPQRSELRDYYSGLAGEEAVGPCDLRIVRMMVDGGSIEPSETGIKVLVWWKQEPPRDERKGAGKGIKGASGRLRSAVHRRRDAGAREREQ